MNTEQEKIEKHVNSHGGGWYNIIDRYVNEVVILWGKGNKQYRKVLSLISNQNIKRNKGIKK